MQRDRATEPQKDRFTYRHTDVHTYMQCNSCIHTYMQCMHACIHTYIQTDICCSGMKGQGPCDFPTPWLRGILSLFLLRFSYIEMRWSRSRRRWLYIQTNRQTDKQRYRQTDIQTYRQTDKQTYRQTDKQTNRHIDKQANRHTCIQAYMHTCI